MMKPRRKFVILAAVTIFAIAAGVAVFLQFRKPDKDLLDVPLGVEEAVIITYAGEPIEPTPYKWGVAVNVRVAEAKEQDGLFVYDVRYIVNRAGEYDLKDYLRYASGRPADGLPSFRMRGSERLSRDLADRIAETEDTGVALRAWYYETLVTLAVVWIGWLLLLIFWPRRKPPVAPPPPPEPTLAEQIRAWLLQLESGALDARQQAQLELMIFRQWREQRSLADLPMAESLTAFRADPEVAEAYTELENWLHRRSADPTARTAAATRVADAVRSRMRTTPAASEEVAS